MKCKWLIYDDRYRDNPSESIVFSVSNSLKEAKKDKRMFGVGVIVRYQVKGCELVNPKIVE